MRVQFVATAIAFTVASSAAFAQQTIFNHPSGDVLGRGEVYVEVDVTHRYQLGFEGVVPRVVWSPVGRLELGLNVGPIGAEAFAGDISLVPNAKWMFTYAKSRLGEWAGIVGTRVYVPKTFDAVRFEGYSFLAYRAPFGLRVTAGVYGDFPTNGVGRAGVTATLEWVFTKFLTFGAEWWSKRDLGVGFIIALPAGFSLYPAYLFSPDGHDGDGVIFEIGKLF